MQKKAMVHEQRDEGFTLVELLLVIVILGVLAGVTYFAVGGLSSQGVEEACTTNVRTIEAATEAYKADTGSYPADLATLETANILKEVPAGGNYGDYTISVDSATGTVTATPACDTI